MQNSIFPWTQILVHCQLTTYQLHWGFQWWIVSTYMFLNCLHISMQSDKYIAVVCVYLILWHWQSVALGKLGLAEVFHLILAELCFIILIYWLTSDVDCWAIKFGIMDFCVVSFLFHLNILYGLLSGCEYICNSAFCIPSCCIVTCIRQSLFHSLQLHLNISWSLMLQSI